MVLVKCIQVFLWLFLITGFTSSFEWERFKNFGLPSRNNPIKSKYTNQNDSRIVLDCYSVQFYLATRQDPMGSTKACLKQNLKIFNGRLNITKPTKILVHGWMNSRETSFTQEVTQAYLKSEDVNVIQVDWSKDARVDYFTAAYRVPEVGNTLAEFISQMVEELHLDVNNLHLVGFSLGAQVVGIAGYYTTPKVAQVIGLDPAGPLFESVGPTGRISTESGQFVVTIHSCKYRLGTFRDSGHLNFNANSGMSQPGCWDSKHEDLLGFCSHDRASHLFAASLVYPHGFLSTRCDSYFEFELELCDDHPTTYFNGNNDISLRGIYFFPTTSAYPFTTQNDTSEQSLILKKSIGFTELSWQKVSKPKTLLKYQLNYKTASDFWRSGNSRLGLLKPATRIGFQPSGRILKDKEVRARMANFDRFLHQMTDFGKRVNAKVNPFLQ